MNKKDWIFLMTYLGLQLLAWVIYKFELLDRTMVLKYYIFLPLALAFLIFDEFHKRFRERSVLLVWAIIGLIQLIVYFLFRNVQDLQAPVGNYIEGLKMLPITLVVMVAFNAINHKVFGDYFISTMGISSSKYEDPIDRRKPRGADYLFSFSGYMIIILGSLFTP